MVSNVLLHVSGEMADAGAGPGRYAVELCRAFGAHLTALVFELDVYSPTGAYDRAMTDAGRDAVAAWNKATVSRAEDLLAAATAAGVSNVVRTSATYAHGVPGIVADHAKLNDVVVPGIDAGGLLSERAIAEHVLFESGRPIIAVPRSHRVGVVAERIVVAWDYSRAAARALHDAMPFLHKASEVTLLTVVDDKSFDNRLPVDVLLEALGRRGINVCTQQRSRGKAAIAETLLDAARDANAELLVMGGYGHSRWREFVLGGATRGMLETTSVPVLLSH